MFEHKQSGSRQRPVTVLTLLFGLMLGFAGGGAQLSVDPNKVRIGNAQSARPASGVRATGRSGDERSDGDGLAVPPPVPTIVTELVSLRPVEASAPAIAATAALDPRFHYHARAPPAA